MTTPPAVNNTIDARSRFRPEGLRYEVQIEVAITPRLLLAVIRCLIQRKKLLITHRFTNDPLRLREQPNQAE